MAKARADGLRQRPSSCSSRCSASRCTSSSTPRRRCSPTPPNVFGGEPNTNITPVDLGLPGSLPGRERAGRAVLDQPRARARLLDRTVEPVRAEELLLPGPREELPDHPVRRADRLRGLGRGRAAPTARIVHGADRARPHGGGRRQADARRRLHRPHPGRRVLARRLQPRRRAARRDRHEADHRRRAPRARARRRPTSRRSATSSWRSASPRRGWSAATCAATPTSRCARAARRSSAPAPRPRTSTRSAPSSAPSATRSSGRPRSSPPAARSRRRRGTGTRTPGAPPPAARRATPTTTGTSPSPTCCPVEPSPELIEELRAALPESPAVRRRRLKAEWGFTDLEFQDVVNAGLLDEIDGHRRGRCRSAGRPQVVDRRDRRASRTRATSRRDPRVARSTSPSSSRSSSPATLTDRLARQVLEGVIAGRGLASARSSRRAGSRSSPTTVR